MEGGSVKGYLQIVIMVPNKYTLHTHTVGFDGRDSVTSMVKRARELGFSTIGISNHLIVNPIIKYTEMYQFAVKGGYNNIYSFSFGEALLKFFPHYHEIYAVQKLNPDIQILRGMEVDFFDNDNWRKDFEQVISFLKPDYIIGSTHFIMHDGTLLNAHDWKKDKYKNIQNILMEKYWTNVKKAAESGLFNWLAHVDLPKKVDLGREEKWAEFENRAIEAAAKSKTAIEINTSFYRPYCYEPYPSNRILNMARENNVPVIISDDAHEVKNIGRHFDEAKQLIRDLNLKIFTR